MFFRSIALAGVALAALVGTVRAEAPDAIPISQSPMCHEVSYTQYASKHHGPPGKYADVVVVKKGTRVVCTENSLAKKPGRAAAVMRYHKSA